MELERRTLVMFILTALCLPKQENIRCSISLLKFGIELSTMGHGEEVNLETFASPSSSAKITHPSKSKADVALLILPSRKQVVSVPLPA